MYLKSSPPKIDFLMEHLLILNQKHLNNTELLASGSGPRNLVGILHCLWVLCIQVFYFERGKGFLR